MWPELREVAHKARELGLDLTRAEAGLLLPMVNCPEPLEQAEESIVGTADVRCRRQRAFSPLVVEPQLGLAQSGEVLPGGLGLLPGVASHLLRRVEMAQLEAKESVVAVNRRAPRQNPADHELRAKLAGVSREEFEEGCIIAVDRGVVESLVLRVPLLYLLPHELRQMERKLAHEIFGEGAARNADRGSFGPLAVTQLDS
ncbi:MAG TPA: hypothetical protein VMS64_21620 [Candidatus Methylomirabilis sp.]|nr:hypothetical protein [Candidatus Methylomirabilis sp.]